MAGGGRGGGGVLSFVANGNRNREMGPGMVVAIMIAVLVMTEHSKKVLLYKKPREAFSRT